MTAKQIIQDINSNGGLDMGYIRQAAKQDGTSVDSYIKVMIKHSYNVHGNTANAVARHYY